MAELKSVARRAEEAARLNAKAEAARQAEHEARERADLEHARKLSILEHELQQSKGEYQRR